MLLRNTSSRLEDTHILLQPVLDLGAVQASLSAVGAAAASGARLRVRAPLQLPKQHNKTE